MKLELQISFIRIEQKTVILCNDNENKDREISGLAEAMEKFKLKEGLLLTNSQEEVIQLGGRKIIVKPVWKWLLEKF